MKKLALIVLVTLSSLSLYAQKNGVGIKAGLSSTQVDFEGEQLVPSDAQLGYHVGVFARFGGVGFFVQPEVLFTQTTGKFKLESPPISSISSTLSLYEAKFNRLDVPVMAGFRLLKVIRIMAGPIASFNIDSSLKDAGTTVQNTDFKKATLGYQTGVGVDLGSLSIEGKYEGGLSKFTENVGSYTADNRLNQWVLSVAFNLF
ncbi:MAG: PorT family protein [Algoriphagus sp.]|jgi:hypothetical protein|nr:PorT family protein [Algoriphagus sp.]MCE2779404.1 PorT family protein [Algoriphagus sp.]